jgi:primosomal protein N' (replication factor Y)
MGTERIEQAVTDIFPKARVVRMDSDSMRGKEAYRKTLEDFAARKIDILVGTQMIAKGLHFPNVTMVGVVQADSALQLPDFRASERVFQLLMQVAGRAGRGAVTGEVFVQTRTPFHPAIQFARHHDFEGFAEQELEFRRGLHYPPYQRMALLTWRGRDEEKTHYVAEQMAKKIATILPKGVEASGPAPAPLAKINQEYRFHYLLRTAHMSHLSKVLRPLVVGVKAPDGVKMTLDVDPVYLL